VIALLLLAAIALAGGVLFGAVALVVVIIKAIARTCRSAHSDKSQVRTSISVPEDEEFQRIVTAEWPSRQEWK
jgi:hypothetical protein